MKYFLRLVVVISLLSGCNPQEGIKDNQGNLYTLNDLKGKHLILNVWATWCPPCLVEVPELNNFYKKYEDKVILLGANFDHFTGDRLYNAKRRFQIHFPLLQGNYEDVFKLDPAESLPTTYIYSPRGDLVKILRGPQTVDSLARAVGLAG